MLRAVAVAWRNLAAISELGHNRDGDHAAYHHPAVVRRRIPSFVEVTATPRNTSPAPMP